MDPDMVLDGELRSSSYGHNIVCGDIGRQYSGLDDRYWNGLIDDFRIYYRALTDQEISGL